MAGSLSEGRWRVTSVVHSQETRIGILVYEGVDLLDVAVPFELFGWVASADSTLSVRLVAAKAGRVTTRDRFRFGG